MDPIKRLFIIFFIVVTLFTLFFVHNALMDIEDKPTIQADCTGKIKGSCYYQGRQYGCLRNLSQLLGDNNG